MFLRRRVNFKAWAFLSASLVLNVVAFAQLAPHDTKYIADKPLLVVWSHPNAHLTNPVFADLFKLAQGSVPADAQTLMKDAFAKLDLMRVSVSIAKPANEHGSVAVRPRAVSLLHFTDAAAATLALESMTKGMKPVTIPEWKSPIYTYAGDAHPVDPAAPQQAHAEPQVDVKSGRGVTQFTPQTIVQAEHVGMMLDLLKPTTAAVPVWAKDLAELAKTQTTVFIDLTQVRDMVKGEGPPPGQGMEAMIFNSVKSLWEQADYVFVSIDTTSGIQISAQAQSPNAESAQRFKGALEGILALGKGFMPTAKQGSAQLNQIQPGLGDTAYAELESLVNSIKITQTDMQTKLSLTMSQESLAKIPGIVTTVVQGYMMRQQPGGPPMPMNSPLDGTPAIP